MASMMAFEKPSPNAEDDTKISKALSSRGTSDRSSSAITPDVAGSALVPLPIATQATPSRRPSAPSKVG